MGRPADENSTYVPAQIAEVRYSHEAMIEAILANPGITQREIARTFGKSEVWISTVVRSDAFQARLAERREEVFGPMLAPLKDKLEALAHASLEKLQERVLHVIPMKDEHLIATTKIALEAAGYGARQRQDGGGGVTFNINLPAKAESEAAWGDKYSRGVSDAVIVEAGTPKSA